MQWKRLLPWPLLFERPVAAELGQDSIASSPPCAGRGGSRTQVGDDDPLCTSY